MLVETNMLQTAYLRSVLWTTPVHDFCGPEYDRKEVTLDEKAAPGNSHKSESRWDRIRILLYSLLSGFTARLKVRFQIIFVYRVLDDTSCSVSLTSKILHTIRL